MEISSKELMELLEKARKEGSQDSDEENQKLRQQIRELEFSSKNNWMFECQDKETARSNQTLFTWKRVQEVITREKESDAANIPDLVESLKEEFEPFDVYLSSYPADKKIPVIKLIRELYGLGLKDAKELSEAIPNALISENVDVEHFNAIKVQFEEIGAKIIKMRPSRD